MYNLLILVYIVQIEDIRGELRESNNKHERCLLLKFTDKMQHGLKTDVKEGMYSYNHKGAIAPLDRAGWPASLPYICKIRVSVAIYICTCSNLYTCTGIYSGITLWVRSLYVHYREVSFGGENVLP